MSRPVPLHLPRLAQGSAGQWLRLPDSALRVVAVTGRVSGQPGDLLCLSGAAVVDLPDRSFVRLRPGEAFRVTGGEWQATALEAHTTLLLVPDGEG